MNIMQDQPSSPASPTPDSVTPPPAPDSFDYSSPPIQSMTVPHFTPPALNSMPVAQTMPVPSSIDWQASEYITREKNIVWFVALGVVATIFCVIALFVMHDVTFAILVVVMTIAVGLFARRPARNMTYSLRGDGLSINDKFFSFHTFRAFGVVREGGIYSITLLPNKRFAPSVMVYFPPEYGEQIVDMLGSVLPMETIKQDFIDRLGEKLHF